MTCREFKHEADSLTLSELSQASREQLASHAQGCEDCGAWLQQQRTLAASMQALQSRTAGLEAGADVERALLQAYRQAAPQRAGVAPREARERSESSPRAATLASTPVAMRLSRLFEIGAYVAVAAAILVALFLGLRLLEDRSHPRPVQSQVAPEESGPARGKQVASAREVPSAPAVKQPSVTMASRKKAARPVHRQVLMETNTSATETGEIEPAYTALMFCDPLSCAAETQVVRVELPPSSTSQSSQPQMADLVVGYDGVVRAVRLVN